MLRSKEIWAFCDARDGEDGKGVRKEREDLVCYKTRRYLMTIRQNNAGHMGHGIADVRTSNLWASDNDFPPFVILRRLQSFFACGMI